MRKWGTAFAVALVGLSTSGCWLQVGGNAARTGFANETTITTSNVATLHQVWFKSAGPYPASAPLKSGGRVFVSHGTLMTALSASPRQWHRSWLGSSHTTMRVCGCDTWLASAQGGR